MPAYGRDWFGKTLAGSCPAVAKETVSRTTAAMEAFAASKGITPQWRDRATSKTFTYTRTYSANGKWCRAERVVWYDDAASLAAKVPLVEAYGLRGIALWALGNEGRGSWTTLKEYGGQLAAG
jgi:spore germination protein